MPCCAQYTDDSWFRACILDYVEQSEQMSVFYVDYGNEETVPKARYVGEVSVGS